MNLKIKIFNRIFNNQAYLYMIKLLNFAENIAENCIYKETIFYKKSLIRSFTLVSL